MPGTFYSLYFRPHDKILSVNKSQFRKLSYLHKDKMFLIGEKKNPKTSKSLNNLEKAFNLNLLEYSLNFHQLSKKQAFH